MNPRIERLRSRSLAAVPSLSSERAQLVTDFYRSGSARTEAVPVRRALAFKYILENKAIYIGKDELIVGERGPQPKATPTYPEVCVHSESDLEIIDSREKVSFAVDAEVKKRYRESIIPYWKNHSIRDKIFTQMPRAWKEAYEAGVFTEFQEQRSPGHTACGSKI
jgi:trans-4-hydroxy-L-proline dehydratase